MILKTKYNYTFINRYDAEFYYKYLSKFVNYIIIFDGENYIPYPKKFNEPPKFCKDWKDLAEATKDNENFELRINFEYGNAELRDKKTGEYITYFSTHTFYGRNYKNSSELLQCYGFNVELDNWDVD